MKSLRLSVEKGHFGLWAAAAGAAAAGVSPRVWIFSRVPLIPTNRAPPGTASERLRFLRSPKYFPATLLAAQPEHAGQWFWLLRSSVEARPEWSSGPLCGSATFRGELLLALAFALGRLGVLVL